MAGVSNSKKKSKKGRPKKGVRYIAQKLRKYYPKRYVNFSEALIKARTIKSELDLRLDPNDKKVILRNEIYLFPSIYDWQCLCSSYLRC